MARPKQAPRLNLTGAHPKIKEALKKKMTEYEQKIRKYYPKKSKFFYNGLYYQLSNVKNPENTNTSLLQRYNRSFFRSYSAISEAQVSMLSQIPHNLLHLTICEGSQIVLRKLIKQNKRLEHIVFESEDDETNADFIRSLRYLKSLRSIEFQHKLPIISKTECKRMLKTWGKTIERIKVRLGHDVANVMEIFLKFPKLKEFELGSSIQSFPYEKFQERDINYSIHLDLKDKSLLKKRSKFIFSDYVSIKETDYAFQSEKMALERYKIEKNSKQRHFLEPKGKISLVPVFQNMISLDVISKRGTWDCSKMGQLTNLKHLSIDMFSEKERSDNRFELLFTSLNNNVAPHKKLETFLIKSGAWGESKKNEKLALSFFESCSETLRKVHFELKSEAIFSAESKWLFEGLSKLKNLQSLSLFLDFFWRYSWTPIERFCQLISEIKSLEELDFIIQIDENQAKTLDLKFPLQLKKLSLALNTFSASLDVPKTLWQLSNLMQLELIDFSSSQWSKELHHINKLKLLEVLILKESNNCLSRNEMSQIKERLDRLMKESSNLKLTIFASTKIEEIIILRRNHCSWSEINPIVDDLSFNKNMKVSYIKTY